MTEIFRFTKLSQLPIRSEHLLCIKGYIPMGSSLIRKYWTTVEVTGNDKHTSFH